MTDASMRSRRGPLVVFLAHAADRTGAPTTLLHQLRWLWRNTDWRIVTVLLRGGPLVQAFADLGPTMVIGEPDPRSGIRPTIDQDNARRRELLEWLTDADLVYVNTAWSVHALPFLPADPERPVIAAIHELDHDLRDGMPAASLSTLLSAPNHFVAGAELIKANLVAGYGVAADRVSVVPEGIDLTMPAGGTPPNRGDFGIADELVVIAAGSPAWRKGPDLFVHLADRVRTSRPDLRVRFHWVGAGVEPGVPDMESPLADRARLGLDAAVAFLGQTDRILDHFRCADLFVLTSREDASPLVCLEAASVGLPIVCFDNGGIPEALGPQGCIEIPYPDLKRMAEVVAALADDPDDRLERGRVAAERVRTYHDIERTGPRLLEVIAPWLA